MRLRCNFGNMLQQKEIYIRIYIIYIYIIYTLPPIIMKSGTCVPPIVQGPIFHFQPWLWELPGNTWYIYPNPPTESTCTSAAENPKRSFSNCCRKASGLIGLWSTFNGQISRPWVWWFGCCFFVTFRNYLDQHLRGRSFKIGTNVGLGHLTSQTW